MCWLWYRYSITLKNLNLAAVAIVNVQSAFPPVAMRICRIRNQYMLYLIVSPIRVVRNHWKISMSRKWNGLQETNLPKIICWVDKEHRGMYVLYNLLGKNTLRLPFRTHKRCLSQESRLTRNQRTKSDIWQINDQRRKENLPLMVPNSKHNPFASFQLNPEA